MYSDFNCTCNTDGKVWAFWNRGREFGIGFAQIDLATGKFLTEPQSAIKPGKVDFAYDQKGELVKEPGYDGRPIPKVAKYHTWDAIGIEGAYVIKHEKTYYLFYSSWTRGYEIGYATAPAISGPWTKHGNEPFYGAQSKAACKKNGFEWKGDPNNPFDHTNMVMTAEKPEGPWSDPESLEIQAPEGIHFPAIDPGFVMTPEGKKYLYVSQGYVVELNDAGTKAVGTPRKVYDGWEYPAAWNVQCMCLESPKLFMKDGYYYLVSAEGGTSGPSTAHMTVVARSKSPVGPWENSPYNPLTHTYSPDEKWWQQGHGTIFKATDGKHFVVCQKTAIVNGSSTGSVSRYRVFRSDAGARFG